MRIDNIWYKVKSWRLAAVVLCADDVFPLLRAYISVIDRAIITVHKHIQARHAFTAMPNA